MGAYLVTGIVQKIIFRKQEYTNNTTAILTALEKEIDLKYYNFATEESIVLWEIKPEMLESNLSEFIKEQFRFYNPQENIDDTIKSLQEAKTSSNIIKLAENERLYDFRMLHPINHYLSIINSNGFTSDIDVRYQMIAFFIDGKIIMECYKYILNYFERIIRLQNEKYPIANCVKVMITG